MANSLSSETALKGELVTVVVKYGGLDLGRLIGGQVWKNAGNGWILAEDDVFGMVEFHRDGGAAYKGRIAKMGLGRF